MNNRKRDLKLKQPLNDIMKLLVFDRILYPRSKKSAYENKDKFFEKNNFSLDTVYRSLDVFNSFSERLVKHISDKVDSLYGRDKSLIYYDVTNYYFEINEEKDLKRKGYSKENKHKPIIQMGLFMDTNSIPITYKLFEGNTNDVSTLPEILTDITRELGYKKTIVVADKGINSGPNIVFSLLEKTGYLYSQKIKGGHKELKEYVLTQDGYIGDDIFRMKERVYPRLLEVNALNGTKKKIRIDEKQVVFYSKKYADRQKYKREERIKKALDIVNNPYKYDKALAGSAASYIKNIEFDKDTGAVITAKEKTTQTKLTIDENAIEKEALFDGYYAIITSELDMSGRKMIDIYRGLWRIEESFLNYIVTSLKIRMFHLRIT
jgi:transposase